MKKKLLILILGLIPTICFAQPSPHDDCHCAVPVVNVSVGAEWNTYVEAGIMLDLFSAYLGVIQYSEAIPDKGNRKDYSDYTSAYMRWGVTVVKFDIGKDLVFRGAITGMAGTNSVYGYSIRAGIGAKKDNIMLFLEPNMLKTNFHANVGLSIRF